MPHSYLSSCPEGTGAHDRVGLSPPYDNSKNPPVIKRHGKRTANTFRGEGFILVQLQDESAEQVRCKLVPEEARRLARELRQFRNELEACGEHGDE
jgi:hypothetical protein